MLLMSTADAAAKHGHEYSTPPPPRRDATPGNHVSFLAQMPLAILGSYLRKQTPSPTPPPPQDAPGTPTPKKHVMTPAHDDATSSPAPSRPVSSGSSATNERLKKRAPRSKTSYLIAKPAQPVNPRHKLHIRPKVLLQLHQVIATQRPKPVYEVIPFSLLPQPSTRRLARSFNTRERLGPNDLLIVKAEAYSSKDEDARSDDDRWGSRDVIAVISSGKCERGANGKTEICMEDATSGWEVTNMPNGGYEFNTTDDHGLALKARWVLKPAHTRRTSGISTTPQPSPTFPGGQDDKKFTFSTISSNSRRHPIIAKMTRTRIDVMDSYAMPSATSPPTPNFPSDTQSPVMTPSSIDMNSFLDPANTALPIETDDALRRFIVASGVWVASQVFSSTDNSSSTPSLNTSATFRPPNHRAASMSFIDSPRSTSPASTNGDNRPSFPKLFRSGTDRLPRSMSFTEPAASPVSTKTTPNASPVSKTRSRRANSTGNTHFHSMTGSMRKRYGLAFEDQALPETEEERQNKRSGELLRIKELVLPSPTDSPSVDAPVAQDKSGSFIKTQSAYNPVTTTGLWDSGVTEGPGLRARPTSMFVMNEKKKKEEKKRERSKSKENRKEERRRSIENQDCLGLKRKSDWYKYKLKLTLKGMFKREKS
ncbi:hypothetical protein BKA66DRAFT_418123 [Pyrenochaeta sp. MPI-SDFR-AT-0127]|nr:hypothetical protein BKA66DRAFT_418123 [Pyrenochaeta sp. MPI-SDFR-AT-0127]